MNLNFIKLSNPENKAEEDSELAVDPEKEEKRKQDSTFLIEKRSPDKCNRSAKKFFAYFFCKYNV